MQTTPAYIRYTIVALILLTATFYGLYQLTLSGNTDPQDTNRIEEYLALTGQVDAEIHAMAATLSAMAESGQPDVGRLTNMLFQIEELKKEIPAEYEHFKELEQRSRLMLETLRQLVLIIYEPAQTSHEERNSRWRRQISELNNLSESRTRLVKELLEVEGFEYHENSDGSLTYWRP